MASEDTGEPTRKIRIPADLLGQSFIDSSGGVWQFLERGYPILWGPFSRTRIELVKSGQLTTSLQETLNVAARNGLSRWKENTAVREVNALARGGESFVKKCLDGGEQNFRKELLANIGAQGERMFASFVEQKFDEVVKIVQEEERQKTTTFATEGPFPARTRFRWELRTPKHTYTAYCLELPPQRRTITIFEEQKRLAFPWVCFLVYFVDGDLYEDDFTPDHGKCGLACFYRPNECEKQGDPLYLCNLPEVDYQFPFGTCLGSSRPPVKLTDPQWDRVLLEWFWGSTFYFNKNINWSVELYRAAARVIPEAKIEKWSEISKQENCLATVCALPWIKCEQNLGQMAKAALEYIAKGNEKTKEEAKEKRANTLKLLASQFREQLEEKILFLGAHFTVPQALVEAAKGFFGSRLSAVTEKLNTSLANQCEKIIQEANRTYLTNLQGKGKKDATVSDLDSRQENT